MPPAPTSKRSAGVWRSELPRWTRELSSMSRFAWRATNGTARSDCRRGWPTFDEAAPARHPHIMRIVAGRWRGRTIKAPNDSRVRPTADRVREAWMSIVILELPGARVVDLFAGSGALGLEALSRGAATVDFFESSPRPIAVLRENIAILQADNAVV